MATYKPHSAFVQSDFNTTDYPAIKFWLPCEETSGTDFTDSVAGVVCRSNGTPTFGTNYVVPNASNGTIASGTLPIVDTLYPIFIAVGHLATGAISIGSRITGGISLNGVASQASIKDTAGGGLSAGTNFTGVTAATLYGRAMIISAYNSATGQQTLECTSTTNTAQAATPTDVTNSNTTAIPSLGAFTASWVCASAVTRLYGMQLICTTSALPVTFIQEMLAWYTGMWSSGIKAPFPGLKGIT